MLTADVPDAVFLVFITEITQTILHWKGKTYTKIMKFYIILVFQISFISFPPIKKLEQKQKQSVNKRRVE